MDDLQDAAAALRALANDGTKVTKKVARLRQLMPEIDALQAAGISHEVILAALNQNGFDLKMGAYSTMLWRIRHGKSKPVKAAPSKPIAATVEPKGEGSDTSPPGPEIEVSEIIETRRRREEKASRFIGTDSNPLIKNLKGTNK